MGVYSPFSSLQLNGSTLQITDTLPAKYPRIETAQILCKRYAASIFFQRCAGVSPGIVVFSVENEDDGSVDNDNEDVPPDDTPDPSVIEQRARASTR